MRLPSSRRKINVIGTDSRFTSGARVKCPECGVREMHIYKQDSAYYFCGNCANKVPIEMFKRETTVEPVDGDNSKNEPKTFICSIPSRRTPGTRGIIEDALRKKGLLLTDYYEIQSG
jgi:hypothetical protein